MIKHNFVNITIDSASYLFVVINIDTEPVYFTELSVHYQNLSFTPAKDIIKIKFSLKIEQ
jgi:hypothetical protein